MEVRSDFDIRRGVRQVMRFWMRFHPDEYQATKRYAEQQRQTLINQHGVEGLSRETTTLAWGFYPGTVFNLLNQYFGPGWDADKRYQNIFFDEVKMCAINQTTKANHDRQWAGK